jgi:hypothetical protein
MTRVGRRFFSTRTTEKHLSSSITGHQIDDCASRGSIMNNISEATIFGTAATNARREFSIAFALLASGKNAGKPFVVEPYS